jgi:2-oxoglutarate ferredoxin oxidoreductase subunit alpha
MSQSKPVLLQGNEACVMGAIKAGMRFFGGYPITPSSEIAEESSIRLPQVGGRFIQMEDEIASMAVVIGASLAGVKSMTATSGPGFSLKQELIGYAAMTEVPVVVASIMRAGPSTGLPTSPAQSDVMQARWGTHGDHPVICICPTSVKEMHDLTITAFNYAEKYRTPVMLMTDEVIAHMREGVVFEDNYEVLNRVRPTDAPGPNYLPYGCIGDSKIPPMAAYGDGYRFHVTGLTHNETGFPTNSPDVAEALVRRLCEKVEDDADKIVINETYMTDDAEVLFVAYGSVARASMYIVKKLRSEGVKAGIFVPKVLWPFPEKAFVQQLGSNVKHVIVPEMNLGQYVLEVERNVAGRCPTTSITKVSGELFRAEEIYDKVMAVINR